MNKFISKRIFPYVIAAALLFSGCGEKSKCEIPARHVHKYVKTFNNGISIERYIDSEYLEKQGYHWTDEYIEITKNDERLYDLIEKGKLFDGADNWEYLFNKMSNNHDYLEFYYEYYTTETYTTTDDKGNTTAHTRRVHHDGWHTNPNDSDNTGDTRLYHHKYYGYRVVNNNGKYELERSPLVDDIRDVIGDYPYFSEECITKVYKEFTFKPGQLKYLSPDDFNVFEQPDLENKDLYIGKIKTR